MRALVSAGAPVGGGEAAAIEGILMTERCWGAAPNPREEQGQREQSRENVRGERREP